VHIGRKGIGLNEPTLSITMKEAEIFVAAAMGVRASNNSVAEIMDPDPLFILYTSGSTGKGMVHTTASYGLYRYTKKCI
jgi:acyl-coenzyme A synthetase/AMP-(fatty) acid ligase